MGPLTLLYYFVTSNKMGIPAFLFLKSFTMASAKSLHPPLPNNARLFTWCLWPRAQICWGVTLHGTQLSAGEDLAGFSFPSLCDEKVLASGHLGPWTLSLCLCPGGNGRLPWTAHSPPTLTVHTHNGFLKEFHLNTMFAQELG